MRLRRVLPLLWCPFTFLLLFHCPVLFWIKTQASSSKCPLTGLLSWTRAWNWKSKEQPKSTLSDSLDAALLSATSSGARTDHTSLSRALLQHRHSCEILQVVINIRLLNNSGLNQKKNPYVEYFQTSAYHLYITIPQLWLKVWLMFCKCEKTDESRKSPFEEVLGDFCTPTHIADSFCTIRIGIILFFFVASLQFLFASANISTYKQLCFSKNFLIN